MATAITHKKQIDPVCGMKVDPATAAASTCYNGTKIFFCAEGCKKAFETNPKAYTVAHRKGFSIAWAKPPAERRCPATKG